MVHLNLPNKSSTTGFVYICPGKFEERAGKPCAGQTGVVMDFGVSSLNSRRSDLFPHVARYDYLITNAWPTVEYPAKTSRSVPSEAEICDEENLRRLHHEIKSLEYLVVCGNLAHAAVRACIERFDFKGKVAYVKHTSRRAIGCPTNANLPAVMDAWAANIIEQLS